MPSKLRANNAAAEIVPLIGEMSRMDCCRKGSVVRNMPENPVIHFSWSARQNNQEAGPMQTPSAPSAAPHAAIADYDEEGYDYRQFWTGKRYEHWAEARVLHHLLGHTQPVEWLVDLGGGFGRHVPTYRQHTTHTVLVDYSWKNLTSAASTFFPEGQSDSSLFLIRADLYRLPFRTGTFDLGITTRVLHHLADVDLALGEMGRVLSGCWILDVPIKHHLLARIRALPSWKGAAIDDLHPRDIGTPDTPFLQCHLTAIRQTLLKLGWLSSIAASVANFRRWERVVPARMEPFVRPLVYGLEMVAQDIGRGWWGPSQFLWLSRQRGAGAEAARPPAAPDPAPPHPWKVLAPLLCCPACQGVLEWSALLARCGACRQEYSCQGAIWDFTIPEEACWQVVRP
jgi:SAM-dependent methyltransferase